jgi:hypothetical protein
VAATIKLVIQFIEHEVRARARVDRVAVSPPSFFGQPAIKHTGPEVLR